MCFTPPAEDIDLSLIIAAGTGAVLKVAKSANRILHEEIAFIEGQLRAVRAELRRVSQPSCPHYRMSDEQMRILGVARQSDGSLSARA